MRGNPAGAPQKSRFMPAVLASVDAGALARHLKEDATTFHTCSVDRALGHVRLYESIAPDPDSLNSYMFDCTNPDPESTDSNPVNPPPRDEFDGFISMVRLIST